MANATTARSEDASRDEELRPAHTDTPIVAYARLIAEADALFDSSSRSWGQHRHPAFHIMYNHSSDAMNASYLHMLDLLPSGDDRDLMILAGHAAMMAEQLVDQVPDGSQNDYAKKLMLGVSAALTAISATLATQGPAVVADVEPIFPELAKYIRRDIMTCAARRAFTEES